MSSIAVIGSTTAIGEGKYILVPDSLTALKITFDNGVLIDGTIEGGGAYQSTIHRWRRELASILKFPF